MLIAVDPGKSGGVSAFSQKSSITYCYNMPETEGDIIDLFKCLTKELTHEAEPITLYMEKLSGFAGGPGNPGSTMFTMAKYYYSWLFLAMYAGIKVELITPQKWQKELGLGTKGTIRGISKHQAYLLKRDWKNKLKERAQQLFPGIKVTLKNADSLLILEYAKKQNIFPF